MMSKFKVGDRVRLKGFANLQGESTVVEGIKGDVTRFYGERLVVHIHRADSLGGNYEVHVYPSQCRRLAKKPRRRVWLPAKQIEEALTNYGTHTFFYSFPVFRMSVDDDLIEFIEVRKKK